MRMAGRVLTFACSLVLISVTLIAAASAASGTVSALGKPVIGKPATVPAQPLAGKDFSVSFRVTRGGSGAPLMAGKMIFDSSIDGRAIQHTQSFRSGTARARLVVPANAAGRLLKMKLTIRAGSQSATKVETFHVREASKPSLSVGEVSAAEGNTGTTTLSFPVTLSTAATQAVSVRYGTADGTATVPSDYAAASGTLTFQPGEKSKTIPVSVVADLAVEPDEIFTLTISDPANAAIARGTATGTITNDDVAAPVTAGAYKGATQEGNDVFLTARSDRTVTGFRVNDIAESCNGGVTVHGGVDWGTSTFPIGNDGSFTAQGSWTGSDVQGDAEWTSETWKVTGSFTSGTSLTGTIAMDDELNYKGNHYRCSTSVTWSATFQG